MKRSDVSIDEVLAAIRARRDDMYAPYPEVALAGKYPAKLVWAVMEQLERAGIVGCGVTLRSGWVNDHYSDIEDRIRAFKDSRNHSPMSRDVLDSTPPGENNCPDCGVSPGENHLDVGCDVERCAATGFQRLSCDECGCDGDCEGVPWSGRWPGLADVERLGWYKPNGEPDLNRLYLQAKWDTETLRWERNPLDAS